MKSKTSVIKEQNLAILSKWSAENGPHRSTKENLKYSLLTDYVRALAREKMKHNASIYATRTTQM